MRAEDIMTREVITVPPDMGVPEVARLFAERGISGAPVVDGDGMLLGIVTETDLMRRLADRRPPGWLRALFANPAELARDFALTHGRSVGDVMTPDLVTVGPEAALDEVTRLLEEKAIRRLPVVDDGRLLGVVSRADLLKAILAPAPTPEDGESLSDDALRQEILRRLRMQPWVDRHFLHVAVQHGEVRITGFARSPAVGQGLHALAEEVPGVRAVRLDLAPPPPFLRGIP